MFGFNRVLIQYLVLLSWAVQYCTFGSVLLWYTLVGGITATVTLALLTYDYDYWENHGVFSPPSYPLVGHIKSVVTFKEQGGMCFKRIYDTYQNEKFLGTHQFYQRTMVIRDPALIKRICVNDFQHFVDRGFFFNKDVDPLAESVLFLRGNEWRKLRAKISPIFSPNKLRSMLPLIENTASEFVITLRNMINNSDDPKDMKDKPNNQCKMIKAVKVIGGYTADAIVPCAFGLKSSVMDDENDPFAVALHAFYEMSLFNIFEKTMRQFWPAFSLFFRMRIIPKKTHDFFYKIVTSVLRARESGVQEKRGDFLDMMMALRSDDKNNNTSKSEDEDVEITDMIISANAFIIFLGGYETTSSTLSFLMLELAVHQEVQDKLRKEIQEMVQKYDGKICYEMLQELSYMDMVIQETLRLYPPFPSIQRMCTKSYVIPGTSTVIERGTIVLFPNLGIQRDEQYFENANAFNPERWTDGLPHLPPGVYMPFGDGPRYCIGKRFAVIQMKCCLVRVLQHVRVGPAAGGRGQTRREPFAADPRSPLTLHPADSRVTISLI